MNRRERFRAVMVAGAMLALMVGASACQSHTEARAKFMNEIRYGMYPQSMASLMDVAGDNEDDLVVDYMDRGMVLHFMGQYEESNEWLNKADQLIEDLFTQSVSDALQAIAWNDSSKPYQGEEFERVMVNVIMALNYLQMDKPQDAMVEVRKVNHKLAVYSDKLAKNEVKNFTYKIDAFANYLGGLISEYLGEYNDAYISYKDAVSGYQQFLQNYGVNTPQQLGVDVLRTGMGMGMTEDVNAYRTQFPGVTDQMLEPKNGMGELVALVGVGRVDHKISQKWQEMDAEGDTISVTYPEFTTTDYLVGSPVIKVADQEFSTQVVHNPSAIARKVLADRNEEVKGKAVARAIALYAAKKAARAVAQSDNIWAKLIGPAVNIGLNVRDILEVADCRSWISLPDTYQMSRIWLAPGDYDVVVDVRDKNGMHMYDLNFKTSIKAGAKSFLVTYTPDALPYDAPGSPLVMPKEPVEGEGGEAAPATALR